MNENPVPSSVQSVPSSSVPPPSQTPLSVSSPAPRKSPGSPYLVMFVIFLVGIGLGYVLVKQFPAPKPLKQEPKKEATSAAPLALPQDAVQVRECVDHKGALFVKLQDTSKGPFYLVYNNTVVGLEYVFEESEFEKRSMYDVLPALDIRVDHMMLDKLAKGYHDEPGTRSAVALFFVNKEVTQTIVCPKPEPTAAASPSAMLESEEQATGAAAVTVPLTQPSVSPLPTNGGTTL